MPRERQEGAFAFLWQGLEQEHGEQNQEKCKRSQQDPGRKPLPVNFRRILTT